MPRNLQYEHQINTILDFQLVILRMIQDPRAPYHDIAGLRNSFEQRKQNFIRENVKSRSSSLGGKRNARLNVRRIRQGREL